MSLCGERDCFRAAYEDHDHLVLLEDQRHLLSLETASPRRHRWLVPLVGRSHHGGSVGDQGSSLKDEKNASMVAEVGGSALGTVTATAYRSNGVTTILAR